MLAELWLPILLGLCFALPRVETNSKKLWTGLIPPLSFLLAVLTANSVIWLVGETWISPEKCYYLILWLGAFLFARYNPFRFDELLAYAALMVSFRLYFGQLAVFLFSNFPVQTFDEPVRYLVEIYASRGLIPYRDFSFVYPPGLYLLIGAIFKIDSIFIRNLLLYGISFCCHILCVHSVWHYVHKNTLTIKMFVVSLSIMALSLTLLWSSGEPITYPLAVILFLELCRSDKIRRNRAIIAACCFSLFFLRWDRLVAVLAIWWFASYALYCNKDAIQQLDRRDFWKEFKSKTKVAIGSILFSVFLSSIYCWKHQIFLEAWTSIIEIPIFVLPAFRNLPVPSMLHLSEHNLFFFFPLLCASYLLTSQFFIVSRRYYSKASHLDFYWAALPLALLPYAMGRSDFAHFVPFFAMCCFALALISKDRSRILLAIIAWLVAFWAVPLKPLLITSVNTHQLELDESLENCRKLLDGHHFESIFVGRKEYSCYTVNYATLYFLSLKAQPATSFTAEDPGVQSSCKYGEIIYKQLMKSKRPILVIIDPLSSCGEANASQSMRSCGHIEKFINSEPYKEIGACSVSGSKFELRLYL